MNLKHLLEYAIGHILSLFSKCESFYYEKKMSKRLGGGDRTIDYPFIVVGVRNINMAEHVHIGPGATIYTYGAKLNIGKHLVVGPNLTIVSGDHQAKPGQYLDSVSAASKDEGYDQDITIGQDVWLGANVTILKGVTIGDSAIIGAGSVVTKDIPPFAVAAGNPAKVIRMKWNDADRKIHEDFLNANNQ